VLTSGLAQRYHIGLDQRSYSTPGPVSTGMGDHLWAGKPPWFITSYSVQLSLLPSLEWKMSTGKKCGDALQLGSKGRYGSFCLWLNV